MVQPRLALHLSNHGSARDVVEAAVLAQDAGVRDVWLSEDLFYRGALATAGAVLARTEHLRVGFGVLVPQTRHPAALAMDVRSLLDLGPGRVVLGLGAGVAERTRAVGQDSGPPLRVVREAVEAVRALLRGETWDEEGVLHASRGLRLTGDLPAWVPPVFVAAVGPKALAQAGRVADGVVLTLMCAVEHARWACAQVAQAAADAGRPAPEVVAYVPVCADDDDPGAARDTVRRFVAATAARWADLDVLSTLFTRWSALDAAALARVRDTVRAGEDAAHLVPDEVVDQFGAAGTLDDCRRTLAAFADAGVTTVAVEPVGGVGPLLDRWKDLARD